MKNILIILAVTLLPALRATGYEQRDILFRQWQLQRCSETLHADTTGFGLPGYYDRRFWNSVPESISKAYIAAAEKYLDYNWPAVKATDFLEFIRSGDRRQEAYGAPQGALTSLIMGELAEGKGRFLDQIVNGVWYYCEQTWWGWSAHFYLQKAPPGLPDSNDHTIDLGVGNMANILSWAWHLFHHEFDKIHPLISKRLKDEIYTKALIPYYTRTDFWWMGLDDHSHINNWNPWINYNMLNCILLMEDDPEKKAAGVEKIVRSLDTFLNTYPEDGGCNEGPCYWGAAGAELFKNLSLLKKVTGGRLDVFGNQLVRNIGNYIAKVYIHLPYFINFADADPQTTSDPLNIYFYGKATGDETMQKFAAYIARNSGWGQHPFGGTIDEQIFSLCSVKEILEAPAEEPLYSDFWLPQTEVAGARDREGSTEGFFFAAKGGFNDESHNHNDAGSFILYYNGKPAIVDVGREKYTAKTFSSNRYDIWTMQSQYHNLPVINGKGQLPGEEYKAENTTFAADPQKAVFSAGLAKAYPAEAKVENWQRVYTLLRGKSFTVTDHYRLQEYLAPTTLNLMTCCRATIEKPGILKLEGDGFVLNLNYNPKETEPEIESIKVTDEKMKQYWPGGLTRLIFRVKSQKREGQITLLFTK